MRGKLSYLTYTILRKLFKLCKNSDILIGGLDTAVIQSSLSRSVAQSCLNLCNRMHCSTTGFPVLHHLLELCQTHGRWAGNAIKPSHPLSSPFPPALSLSQHQGLFQWVSSLYQVAKVLELQLQHQDIQDWFLLGLTGLISLQCKGLSRVFSNITVKKHQFFSTQPSLWSNSHIHTWLLKKP